MQKIVIQNVRAGRDLNIFVDTNASGGVPAPYQLPSAHELYGRQNLLTELKARLEGQSNRKGLLVHGMPGVGKTGLLVSLGHMLRKTHGDAQIFVSFGGAADRKRKPLTPTDAIRIVIQSFRPAVEVPEDADQMSALYRSVLTEAGNVLLVFDDLAGPEQLAGLCPPPNCAWILSSRNRITHADLETVELDCLDHKTSVELLLNLAPSIGALAPTIADLSGGLPLALRFFTARVNEQPLTPVEDLIQEFRASSAIGPVSAAIQLSYARLSIKLQMRLSLLVVFAGDFQISAAQGVWELEETKARDELQHLLNVNLLQYDHRTERFGLHDLVRAYIEGLHPDWILQRARVLHAHHYSLVSDLIGALMITGRDDLRTGLRLFDQERREINAAFCFIREEKSKNYAGILADLGHIAGLVGSLRFSCDEHAEWLMATRVAAKRAKNADRYIDATGNLANAYLRQNEFERARPYAMELLEFGRRHRDRIREGNALTSLALIERQTGHPQRAIELLHERLVIARETGDDGAVVGALNNLANAHCDLKNPDEQMRCLRDALTLAESRGDASARAVTMNNLGCAFLERGQWDEANRCFEERLSVAHALGDVDGAIKALGNLFDSSIKRRDPARAYAWLEKLTNLQQTTGDRRGEFTALTKLILLCTEAGDIPRAVTLLERQRPIFVAPGELEARLPLLNLVGVALVKSEDYTRAQLLLEEGLRLSRRFGNAKEEANALGNLGVVFGRSGDPQKAVTYHLQSLELEETLGDKRGQIQDLYNLGSAYRRLGRPTEAIEFYLRQILLSQEIGDKIGEANGRWQCALACREAKETSDALQHAEAAIRQAHEAKMLCVSEWATVILGWNGTGEP